MNNWLSLSKKEQINLFNQASNKTGLPPETIEKDAWVTLILRMLFSSELSPYIVFKGGTSLSKAYKIIERFSEDIDLVIDKEYFNISSNGITNRTYLERLRRASHLFSLNTIPEVLKKQFSEYGVSEDLYDITVPNIKVSTQDPEVVFVQYNSVFDKKDIKEEYLKSHVLIETGARFLSEPNEEKQIMSIIDENFTNNSFTESPFFIKSVSPDKTMLEKMILLHEEFNKPEDNIRNERMSRHLYDIYKISKTEYKQKAIKDSELFATIVNHRKIFTPIKPIDYDNLKLKDLDFIPYNEYNDLYKADYKKMQLNMIYDTDCPSYENLIKELESLKIEIR